MTRPGRCLAAVIVVILILRSRMMAVMFGLVSMGLQVRTGRFLSAIHVSSVGFLHDPAAPTSPFVMLNRIPSHFPAMRVFVVVPVFGVLGELRPFAFQRTL